MNNAKNKAKMFIRCLLLKLAEEDFLNPAIPVEKVVAMRFQWKTEKEHQQLINAVIEWRKKGKVNWKDEIEEG